MEFKFNMGAEVQTHNGIVGKVIARIETLAGLYYKILEADGQGHEVSQKLLWIVSCVPAWLRPGEEVQWMGEGPHERYVVKELCRGREIPAQGFRCRTRADPSRRHLVRSRESVHRMHPCQHGILASLAAEEAESQGQGQLPERACRKKSS